VQKAAAAAWQGNSVVQIEIAVSFAIWKLITANFNLGTLELQGQGASPVVSTNKLSNTQPASRLNGFLQ
jgi:hypothetical protein